MEGVEALALRNSTLLSDMRMFAVETHGNCSQISGILYDCGFRISSFKTDKADMLRKAANLDFLRDVIHTHFSVSGRGTRFLLNASNSPFVPTGFCMAPGASKRRDLVTG